MIKSMTGFGRYQATVESWDICFEIKAVNHRYFEFFSRIPRNYSYLEANLKKYVQRYISRGKIEAVVTILPLQEQEAEVEINHSLAKSYLNALRQLGSELGLQDDIRLTSISRFSDIFTIRKTEVDEEALWQAVKSVADTAIANFIAMRTTEGEKMKQDILSRLQLIEEKVLLIQQRSPQIVEEYRAKLTAKIEEVLQDAISDPQRILTEAAIFADRIATDEETVRLHSHLEQFRNILESDEPVGRKLDFLVQEMNRETNTIGSKSNDLEITRIVVDIKAEIEKIREQIQNIE